jgi:hypothetical protein
LKYINIVPAENTTVVGDAFNSDNFIQDHIAAFNALKNFEFDRIGSIGYEHIYSVLDEFQEDWIYNNNKMDSIFHFCRRIVELTQSFKTCTGHRIANDATTPYNLTDNGDVRRLLCTLMNLPKSARIVPLCVLGPPVVMKTCC